MLQRLCDELANTREGFARHKFTPHDFRRLFATDLVNSGLPIHIGAKLLGHLDLQTTQGYVAVFEEDLVRHYQDSLARRRAQRPADEYTTPTKVEWSEFEEHFDRRKVELGSCGRPYGTPCQHEHACVRCPLLHVDPKMLPRLVELERDLRDRRRRAEHEGWTGEIEGIDLTLRLLAEKKAAAERAGRTRPAAALLGMPATRRAASRRRQTPAGTASDSTLTSESIAPGTSGSASCESALPLPAARAARDELVNEGRTVSRDALARRMRRKGHSIRNNRGSELLAALRQEAPSVNGRRPTAAV
jgi:hypothetical protein